MGTTFSSIHIYSPNAVCDFPDFRSFSEGWQTYMPMEEQEDPFVFQKLARKLSKKTDAPVLWFYTFDSEYNVFVFYRDGKRVAAYSQRDGNKNLYSIPALVGYESGQKQRLSKILSCASLDLQITLLEEYFGVCLLPLPELLEESPELLSRVRSETQYRAYMAEEKRLTGKRAPVEMVMVLERTGKVFLSRFGDGDMMTRRPHYYYFGYDTPESTFQNGALRPVHFEQGKLVPVSQEEFDAVPKVKFLTWAEGEGEIFSDEFYPTYKVHFTEKAPAGFRNKTLTTPPGFYFYWFDEKCRAILSDEHGGLAVVDDSLKVIAKMRVKGRPVDFVDGCILTVGRDSIGGYGYDPFSHIRIYRMVDKE